MEPEKPAEEVKKEGMTEEKKEAIFEEKKEESANVKQEEIKQEQETQKSDEPKPEETKEDKQEPKEEELTEEEKASMPFPEAAVVRIMKRHLDGEKMIKKEVKIAMNKWLGRICSNVAKEMNKFPYVMMNIGEFKEGTRVYDELENFDKEKERILAHLDAIKKDIERLERDMGKEEEETDFGP